MEEDKWALLLTFGGRGFLFLGDDPDFSGCFQAETGSEI